MKSKYEQNALIIKALSDPNRLKIVEILSCGELCACDILSHFQISQPTLSHHLKTLTDSGLVISRKEGLWNYFSLNIENCDNLIFFLKCLLTGTSECICNEHAKCVCK